MTNVICIYTCTCMFLTLWVYSIRHYGRWFSSGTSVSSTNKNGCHNVTEILLKVALNTIALTLNSVGK